MRKKVPTLNLSGKIFLCFTTFLVCFLVSVIDAQGQYKDTIYIDPTYAGGSNDGSLQHPFHSWTNITTWQDSIFYAQRRGTRDTMNGTFFIHRKRFVKIGVYGEGTDYAHLHNRAIGRDFKTFNLAACYRSIIDSMHLSGSVNTQTRTYTLTGVYITDDNAVSTFPGDGNKVTNCFIEKYEWGIRIIKFNNSPFDTVTIENTRIHDIADDGMFIQGFFQPLRGLDINGCYIDSVNMKYWHTNQGGQDVAPGDGIQLSNLVDGFRIRNCIIDRRNNAHKFCIIVNDDSNSNTCSGIIENCTLYASDLGPVTTACYFENLEFITFKNNKVFCNGSSMGISTRENVPLLCAYNTFSRTQSGIPPRIFDLSTGPNYLYNNTIYGAAVVIHTIGFPCFVNNNIFAFAGTVYDGNVLTLPDNNLFFNSTPGELEPNSVYNVDPLFAGAVNGDFSLKLGSPAMDRGKDLGYTSDIVGTSLPQGQGFEIGAYEYIPTETREPSRPDDVSAFNITYTGFKLRWKPSRDKSGIVGYNVYVNNQFYSFVDGTVTEISGLTQGTKYLVSVKAKDGNGNISDAGKTFAMTKKAFDKTAPTTPSGLMATDIGQTRFTFSWNASTDNVGVFEYQVFRDGVLYSTVTGTSLIVVSAAETVYSMTVKAKDAVGNTSALSDALSVTTLAQCTGSDPFTNSSFPVQTGTFVAEFDVVPGGDGMDGLVALSNGPATAFGSLACIVRFTTNGLADARNSGVYTAVNRFPYQAGTSYHVKMVGNIVTKLYDIYIRKTSETNETILGSQFGFRALPTQLNNLCQQAGACHLIVSNFTIVTTSDTELPGAPTGLTYNNLSSSGLTLSWNASTDNVGVTGYDILRDGVLYGSVTGTSAAVTGLASATTYTFTVKAKDGGANVSLPSEGLNVTTLVDTEAPSVPKGLAASDISETSFVLLWNPSTDNAGVAGYDVYMDGSLFVTVTSTYAFIYGLTEGTTYSMTVRAKDATGNVSGPSKILKVRTLGICWDDKFSVASVYEEDSSAELALKEVALTDANQVMVYPNPANRMVNVRMGERSSIKITDTNGKVLISRKINPGNNEISIDLKPGLYIIKVISGNNKVYLKKLIVK